MKLSNSEKISIASLIVTIIIAAISKDINPIITWSILLAFALAMIIYLTYLLIQRHKKSKSLSNAAVIAKTDKSIQYLKKLMNVNDKRLSKIIDVSRLKETEKINKRILKRTKGRSVDLDPNDVKLQKLLKQINEQFSKTFSIESSYVNRSIIKATQTLDFDQSFALSEIIIKHILDLERILLQIEQYDLRISMGKYVVKYATNANVIIKGYVDYIGWTNILLGNYKQGIEAITQGIRIIESIIGTDNTIPEGMKEEDYYHYKFLKARALRHLSTTYYSYSSNNFNKQEVEAVYQILNEENFKNYFLKTNPNTYYKMLVGVDNNYMLYQFYQYKEHKKENHGISIDFNKMINKIDEDLDIVRKMPPKEQDRHRIIKLSVLKNQILRSQRVQSKNVYDAKEFKEGLDEIKTIFNANIYLDDGLEVYINEAVQDLYDDVLNILESQSKE